MHTGSFLSKREAQESHDRLLLTTNQQKLFHNCGIILSNFSFNKPIESLQTCISMASLHHQHVSIRLLSTLICCKQTALLKLHDFAGHVIIILVIPLTTIVLQHNNRVGCLNILSILCTVFGFCVHCSTVLPSSIVSRLFPLTLPYFHCMTGALLSFCVAGLMAGLLGFSKHESSLIYELAANSGSSWMSGALNLHLGMLLRFYSNLAFSFLLFCLKVLPEKHSLKMIKNYSVQVNWFVFLVRGYCMSLHSSLHVFVCVRLFIILFAFLC